MLVRSALLLALLSLAASPASAQILDDFQTGTDGWQQGEGTLMTAENIGMSGSGEHAIAVVSSGGGGALGRPVMYNTQSRTGDEWVGNWAGRDQVSFRVYNDTGNTLALRLAIEGAPFQRFVTSASVSVPSSAQWQTVMFDTRASAFASSGGSSIATTYANVSHFRILHNPSPSFVGAPLGGTFYFDDITDGALPGVCGNNVVDAASEDCDGTDLDGEDCQSRGFDGGPLGCTGGCELDTSACTTCGDGTREGAEVCDLSDVAGQSCVSRGFDGGPLGCNGTCTAFDESACTDCGDGTREGAEVCDMSDLNGQSCTSQGLGAGSLACNSTCDAFDASGCSACGNSTIDSGEVCDGSLLGGQTCASQGFDGGALACAGCSAFDTSACFGCGDGVINGTELCDGASVGAETCVSQGFAEGTLACDAGCEAYDTGGCATCGDSFCTGAETLTSCSNDCVQTDDFEDMLVADWQAGSAGPAPTVVAGAGPEGDHALVVAPSGSAGRLVAFNTAQWAANFSSRERTQIYAHVANLGPSAVELRLGIDGPGGRFVTTDGIALEANSGFRVARWSLEPSDLTADGGTDVNATLSRVGVIRIVHGTGPSFVGVATDSSLALDNVSDLEPTPICGDGAINAGGEICDDGNRVDGDGCSATCGSDTCGDGVVQSEAGERCDEGANNSDTAPDACRENCQPARCGDRAVDTGEACDTFAPAGETCISQGYFGGRLGCSVGCAFDVSDCERGCGDGRVQAPEQCDDGNMADGDGCSATCRFERDAAPEVDAGRSDGGGVDAGMVDAGEGAVPTGSCSCRGAGGVGAHSPMAALGVFGLLLGCALRRRRR